ncbi:MFS transporter [Kribbella sp. NPDC026611]|uniref:MFS transporter n=1 Tax=Kribbella sp. NPDC026611 TaxID=3154911 RepID=UPI0034024261
MSVWDPLRNGAYRMMWTAGIGGLLGSWMQLMAAQWILVELSGSPVLIALVNTSSMLPVLLLALPAGVLADVLDRRRMLLTIQVFQVCTATAMAALALVGRLSPPVVLLLIFMAGCGTAMGAPTYQGLVSSLILRRRLQSTAALDAFGINLTRAIGPLLGGVLLASWGASAVFGVTTVLFGAYAAVLGLWRQKEPLPAERGEPFIAALRAGGRYVRYSSVMRRMLWQLAAFLLPASCFWALLPLVTARGLGHGAGGYGLALAAAGGGAAAGAPLVPWMRRRLGNTRLPVTARLVFAAAVAALSVLDKPVPVLAVLVISGVAWTAALTDATANVQMFLPQWVRARGSAAYQVVLFGAQAGGALLWGLLAQGAGVTAAYVTAAVLIVLSVAIVGRKPAVDWHGMNREPAVYWPEPDLAQQPQNRLDPVAIQVTYRVPESSEEQFVVAMSDVQRSRRRTGATSCELWRIGELPGQFLEIYVVPSWGEHLRQHHGRLTGADRAYEEKARALCVAEPEVLHLLLAEPAVRRPHPAQNHPDDRAERQR